MRCNVKIKISNKNIKKFRSEEQRAKSRGHGAWSAEEEAESQEPIAKSTEQGARGGG